MSTTLNASTSSGFVQTADTSGTLELQSNGTTQLTVASTGAYGTLKSATAQASTSGTSIDFTSIPSWVKRITVMFQGVSTSGTSAPRIQIGTSGTPTTSGYSSLSVNAQATGNAVLTGTSGWDIYQNNASYVSSGSMTITNISGNIWVASGVFSTVTGANVQFTISGSGSLAGTLNMVRITTANGTDTFDAGTINIIYEG